MTRRFSSAAFSSARTRCFASTACSRAISATRSSLSGTLILPRLTGLPGRDSSPTRGVSRDSRIPANSLSAWSIFLRASIRSAGSRFRFSKPRSATATASVAARRPSSALALRSRCSSMRSPSRRGCACASFLRCWLLRRAIWHSGLSMASLAA